MKLFILAILGLFGTLASAGGFLDSCYGTSWAENNQGSGNFHYYLSSQCKDVGGILHWSQINPLGKCIVNRNGILEASFQSVLINTTN